MKLSALQTELKKVEERRAKLQEQIRKQSAAIYTGLPQKVGLKSVDALVQALAPYASPSLRSRLNGVSVEPRGPMLTTPSTNTSVSTAAKPKAKTSALAGKPKRQLTQHSESLKATVRQALQNGASNSELSRKHGIALGTLKKWKRSWGLTASGKPSKAG